MPVSVRGRALAVLLSILSFLLRPDLAFGQSHTLVPLLSEHSGLPLSNTFGVPVAGVVNDSGDHAFIGARQTAAFYKKSTAIAPERIIQVGDRIPGLLNTRVLTIQSILLNNGGVLVLKVEFASASRVMGAILQFSGSTLQTLMTSFDTAPGTGGAKFERGTTLIALNDGGTVLFGSNLLPGGSTSAPLDTVFVIPTGGAPIRVGGPGDAAPSTGGTFTSVLGYALNNSGDVLLTAAITAAPATSALYMWNAGTYRKVVANGDPNPVGGTFSDSFTSPSRWLLNNAGQVFFGASSTIFLNTQGGGTIAAVPFGSAVPAPVNGTFGTPQTFPDLSNAGDFVFTSNITGGNSALGMFRYRQGTGVQIVAYVGQTVPSAPLKTFQGFAGASVNDSGTVSFQGNSGGEAVGIFQKTAAGALTMKALHRASATPSGGAYLLIGNPTRTLPNDTIFVRNHIVQGLASHGHFIIGPAPFALMTTDMTMPGGARTFVRNIYMSPSSSFVGFIAQRAGGHESIGVLNPATQATSILATDGDPVPGFGTLARMVFTTNAVFVNNSGRVAFTANLLGVADTKLRPAILTAAPVQPVVIVAYDESFDSVGNLISSLNLSGSFGARPSPINASGAIAFTALVNSGQRGVFVGSASGVPQKVAVPGDVATTGFAISTVASSHAGINDSGIVLFGATASVAGVFRCSIGTVPVPVALVGGAAPGGGTYSGFGTTPLPMINNSSQVAFVATVSGGSGGGVFLSTPGQGTSAIALNGQATPAGGTYVINTARPDVVLNNQGDVLFQSDLTGGSADSGYFIKRGANPVETVVVQGQSAVGTLGTFMTFTRLNGFPGEFAQLSEAGEVAYFGQTVPPGQGLFSGYWHFNLSNQTQPMMIAPSELAAFNGGTAAAFSNTSGWLSGSRYVMWVAFNGGWMNEGLLTYLPVQPITVNPGTGIAVTPTDPVTNTTPVSLVFENVTNIGVAQVEVSASGPRVPKGFWLGQPARYYDVTTTASFTGAVTVCINFSSVTFPAGATLRLMHYENGVWVDVTTNLPNATTICGTVTSLSPFTVAQALNEPISNLIVNGTFSTGISSWSPFEEPDIVHNSAANGVFEYYRASPTTTGSGQAVLLQDTGVAFAAGAPVVAHFDLGNSDPVRKRISVLIRSANFLDLHVCTFWLPANAPMRTYAMRTHTTIAWAGASISFYAASSGSLGGSYRLDNVVMGAGAGTSTARTDCLDPLDPGSTDSPDGASLLTNGGFSGGNGAIINGAHPNSPWIGFGTITAQVTSGVAQFIRPSNTAPAGALVQSTGIPVAAGNIVTATFELGNSSAVRKRVTILVHDQFFVDLAACTFWLPANQPLSPYTMRTYVTANWGSAMISFYPAVTDVTQWFTLDNVSMNTTPGASTSGSDCIEPGGDAAPGAEAAPAPEPLYSSGNAAPEAELVTRAFTERGARESATRSRT